MARRLVRSFLLLCPLAASAQTIHLNVHEARTGRPLKTLQIEFALFSLGDTKGRRQSSTIGPAGLDVITHGAEYIQLVGLGSVKDRMHEYGECGKDDCKSGEGFKSARVADVLSAGVVSGHVGTTAKITRRPGTLDVYVRKISLFERLLDRFNS